MHLNIGVSFTHLIAFKSSYSRRGQQQRYASVEILGEAAAWDVTHVDLVGAINCDINIWELVDISQVQTGLDDEFLALKTGRNIPEAGAAHLSDAGLT